jgi:hypothetical protein
MRNGKRYMANEFQPFASELGASCLRKQVGVRIALPPSSLPEAVI